MLGAIIVCRMSSSRLAGKTLMPLGNHSVLFHIISRMNAAGFENKNIIVCTSTDPSDAAIIDAAREMGCASFAGSLDNVSRRVIEAAEAFSLRDFILILGDNPWVDIHQVRTLVATCFGSRARYDYGVSATPELSYIPEDEGIYPTGTRIQFIRREFMERQLLALESADASVREHVSRLFLKLPNGTRSHTLYPTDGYDQSTMKDVNISINTRLDYDLACRALNALGDPLVSTKSVTEWYLRHGSKETGS